MPGFWLRFRAQSSSRSWTRTARAPRRSRRRAGRGRSPTIAISSARSTRSRSPSQPSCTPRSAARSSTPAFPRSSKSRWRGALDEADALIAGRADAERRAGGRPYRAVQSRGRGRAAAGHRPALHRSPSPRHLPRTKPRHRRRLRPDDSRSRRPALARATPRSTASKPSASRCSPAASTSPTSGSALRTAASRT